MSRMDQPAGEPLREKAKDVRQDLREMAQIAGDAARARYEQAREAVGDYVDMGKERMAKVQENVETYVREKPIQSVLIAAGTGVLLGLLLRSRR